MALQIKRFNIHDFCLILLCLLPLLPLNPINIRYGHTYWFELGLLIYGLVNFGGFLAGTHQLSEIIQNIKKENLFQIGLLFMLYFLINTVFSFLGNMKFSEIYRADGLKIHINILRAVMEFIFVFIFIGYNLKKAGRIKLKNFILILCSALAAAVVIPGFVMILKINVIRIIDDPEYYFNFRKMLQSSNRLLPDGVYAVLLSCFLYYFFSSSTKLWQKILIIIIFVFCCMAVLMDSRLIFFGFLTVLFVQMMLLLPEKYKRLAMILFCVFLIAFSPILYKRLIAYKYTPYDIGSGRLFLIGGVYSILAQGYNVISGTGMGNFYYYTYQRSVFLKGTFKGLSGPHNQLLTVFSGMGIFGYILLIYFLGYIIKKVWNNISHNLNRTEKTFQFSLFSVVTAFIIMGLFADMTISLYPQMTHYILYLWIFMGIIASRSSIKEPPKNTVL